MWWNDFIPVIRFWRDNGNMELQSIVFVVDVGLDRDIFDNVSLYLL